MQATGNPLVAQYTVSTSEAATVVIQFGPDQNYGYQTSAAAVPSGGGAVNILVAGMQQNRTYHMRAVVTFSDGSQVMDGDQSFVTGTIPAQRIPAITTTTTTGATPTAGVSLMSLTIGNAGQLMALATDSSGQVVWYYDYDIGLGLPQPIKLLPNGHMLAVLYLPGAPGGTVREFDLAGNTISQFDYSQLDQKLKTAGYNINVYSIDHDFIALPNGHLLIIISDTRTFNDLPGYPGQTLVTGNAVVELDGNRNPVWVWDAFDHLDINRHPMLFPDWTHANALIYSADDGNLLLSLRHQHWILKLDYQNGSGSGDVLWKLGAQGDFTLASGVDSDWFYAQHDANFASTNTTGSIQLAMFDNGDNRPVDANGTPCAGYVQPLCYSAGAIFDVDETNRTANRSWSYQTPFSWWGGSARVLPNSNVFITETTPADLNLTGTRVIEVTGGANPSLVWKMEVAGQNSYRTIHLPSLYPGVQW